jgi:FkbM family methyltransferase
MRPLLPRLRRRWQTARRFAAAAHGTGDWWKLGLAGVARERPFDDDSAYSKLGRMLGRNVTARLRRAGGARLGLALTDIADLMIFEEVFLDGIYPLESLPMLPDTIIDCGACAGFFTVLAHARFPAARMHVFEPEPGNLSRLHRNLALNGLAVEVHPAAVGLREGTASFIGHGFGGHLARAGSLGTIEVPVVDFPRFLQVCSPERLLLKIDIEGAEAELLPALTPVLPSTTAIFLETHHPEDRCQQYLQPLLDAGFAQRVIRRRQDATAQTDYVERLLLRT